MKRIINSIQFSYEDFSDLHYTYGKLLPKIKKIPNKGDYILSSDGTLFKIDQVTYIISQYEMFLLPVIKLPFNEGDIIFVDSNNSVFQLINSYFYRIHPKNVFEALENKISILEKLINTKFSEINDVISFTPDSIV